MKTFIVLLFLLLIPATAHAGDWSFGVDGGLAVPTQNYFPTNPGDGYLKSITPYPLQSSYFQALEASEGWMVSAYILHDVWKPWFHVGILGSYDTTGTSANAPVDPSQYFSGAVKTNLGMIETWAIMPYVRIDPWIFGNWTPFFGIGSGWSWNQWNTQGNIPGSFSASLSNAVITRFDLGTTYAVSTHSALEGLVGVQIDEPLGSVNLPNGQGGMDQNFDMVLFFAEVGVHFGF